MLKNIMVIDGAKNAVYDIFAIEEKHFREIFSGNGQNIEFVNDFVERCGERRASTILGRLWKRPMRKSEANGIHGILFYKLDYKKDYYPSKIDEDAINPNGTPLRGHKFIWDI